MFLQLIDELLMPLIDVFEAVSIGDVVANDCGGNMSIEESVGGAIGRLACCVSYRQFDVLFVV